MRNKKIRLITAIMLTIIMIPVNCVFADEADYGKNIDDANVSNYGYIDPGLDLDWADDETGLQKYGNLPSKYDMREQDYGSKIAIRNQDDTGLCWAFATMTAAEINYYHTYGADAENKMFSPLHLGYFTYNRVADPMNMTKSDKNILERDNYKMIGGNCVIAMNSLSGWTGFALESKMPFENRYNSDFDKSLAYDNDMILKGSYLVDPDNIDAIKAAVIEYGSVTTGVYMHDSNRFDSYKDENGVYNSGTRSSNHMVVIIGWDDSINAWLIQNSWNDDWGDNGCFYVSYDDPSMDLIAAVEVQPADAYDYNYFYDGTAGVEMMTMEQGSKAANMYNGYDDGNDGTYHTLEAVGLTVYALDVCEYTIDVYTGCDPGAPATGVKKASFDVETNTAGYYTFELPEPVKVEVGEKFSVVITFHQDTDVAIETTSNIGNDVNFSAKTGRGQSFITNSRGRFTDCNDDNTSVRIKAFTNTGKYKFAEINRFAGATRYMTAEAVSEALMEKQHVSTVGTMIIASGENYPDALAGSYLSKVNGNAPIILTGSTVENDTLQYVRRVMEAGGKIYILGGTGVVSSDLEKRLIRNGFDVERLAGTNRYGTNLAILEEANADEEDILICSGSGYADSLSAAAVGKPILLVGDSLTREQEFYLDGYYNGCAYIVGGIGAVNSNVENEIMSIIDNVYRLEGYDRYHTSALVAETFFGSEAETIVFAYAQNFPDGLSGGAFALEVGAPLLLVDGYEFNAEFAKEYAGTIGEINQVYVLGGEPLIPDDIIRYITKQ